MEVQVRRIQESIVPFNILLSKDIRANLGFLLGKCVMKRIREITEDMEEQRMMLIKKYAVLDEGGLPQKDASGKEYLIKDKSAFEKDINAVLDEVVTIEARQVKLSELGDVCVPPAIFATLDWLIVEG